MFKGGKPAQRYVPGQIPGGMQAGNGDEKKKRMRTKRSSKEKDELDGTANGDGVPTEEIANLKVTEQDEVMKKIRNLAKKVCQEVSQSLASNLTHYAVESHRRLEGKAG